MSIFRNRAMKNDGVVYTEMLANREDDTPTVGLRWDWETMTVEEDDIDFSKYFKRKHGENEDDE